MVITKSAQVTVELFTSAVAEITAGLRKHKNVTYGARSFCYSGITMYKFNAR